MSGFWLFSARYCCIIGVWRAALGCSEGASSFIARYCKRAVRPFSSSGCGANDWSDARAEIAREALDRFPIRVFVVARRVRFAPGEAHDHAHHEPDERIVLAVEQGAAEAADHRRLPAGVVEELLDVGLGGRGLRAGAVGTEANRKESGGAIEWLHATLHGRHKVLGVLAI